LTITASDASSVYGDPAPAITPSYSGFVAGDAPASLTATPSCIATTTPVTSVGTYPAAAMCGAAASANYSITYVAGAVTISAASQEIAFTSTAPAHPVVGQSFTLAATGGTSGNPVVLAVAASSTAEACTVSGDVVSFTALGTCTIEATQAADANHDAAPSVATTFMIDTTAPTFTAGAQLPNPTVGVAYAAPIPGSGSPAPTYALVDGTLSPGITLGTGADGAAVHSGRVQAVLGAAVLTGTATATGTFTFTLEATNRGGTAQYTFTITVNGPEAVSLPSTGTSTHRDLQVALGLMLVGFVLLTGARRRRRTRIRSAEQS
jgi:LPXTG-motif cell wall-anchored protein